MPHPSHGTSSAREALLLRLPGQALTCYLSPARIDQLADGAGWPGRHRVFDPSTTLFTIVDQALHAQSSQQAAVSRLAAARGRLLDRDSGAFCRARHALWTPLAQAAAQDAFLTARAMTPGPRRWLVDGCSVALAPSAANQAAYPQSTSQPAGCGDPQLHLVALVDQATGCVVKVARGTLCDHDAKLARPLWDSIPRGDLLIADRGFASYGLLAAAGARGFQVIVRQHQRRLNDTPLPDEVDCDDRLELWRRPATRPDWWDEQQPARLAVRVVRQRLDNGDILTLNTNLSPAQASTEEVLTAYRQRWGIETRFLELKVRLGLEPLRAATPALAETLLWAWLLAHNLLCCLLCDAAQRTGRPRAAFSYQGAVAALDAAALLPPCSAEESRNWVLGEMTRNPLPCRRAGRRDEPRMLRSHHRAYRQMVKPRAEYHQGGQCPR